MMEANYQPESHSDDWQFLYTRHQECHNAHVTAVITYSLTVSYDSYYE